MHSNIQVIIYSCFEDTVKPIPYSPSWFGGTVAWQGLACGGRQGCTGHGAGVKGLRRQGRSAKGNVGTGHDRQSVYMADCDWKQLI